MYCVSLFQGCYRPRVTENRENKKIEVCSTLHWGRRVRSRKGSNLRPYVSRVTCVHYQLCYCFMLTLQARPIAPWDPAPPVTLSKGCATRMVIRKKPAISSRSVSVPLFGTVRSADNLDILLQFFQIMLHT